MWNKKNDKKEDEDDYVFENDKVALLRESMRDSEKVILNCDVNIRQLNRMLLNPNKKGTAEIAQSLDHYEKQKKQLIEGIEVINDMILETHEENDKKGKTN